MAENSNKQEDQKIKGKANAQDDTETTVRKAHIEAEKDIEKDPDFQPDPTTDLDEGELAKLEGED